MTVTANPTIVRIKSEIASLATEVKPLAEKSVSAELTAEENVRFDELVGQINAAKDALQAAVERENQAAKALGDLTQYTDPADRSRIAAGVSKDTATDPTTGQPFDSRSLGRIVATSTQVEGYRKQAKGKSEAVEVRSFFPEHRFRDYLEHHEDMDPLELRTLIFGGALPADMLRPQLLPGIYRGNEPVHGFRAALLSGTTTSDAITFMRELVFTNAAAEVAEAISLVTGGKPESGITFEQATAPVQTVAHWIPITRQTLMDVAMMRTYVEGRLIDGLNRRINTQLVVGDGVAPNLLGITNTPGIQSLTTAGEFTSSPVQDAGTNNENFNRIRRGKRHVRLTGDAMPTFVLLNPVDLENFETISNADLDYLAGDPMTGRAIPQMWGLPVIEDEAITAGTALVGDGTMAAVWDRMDAQIFVADQHADFFIRNIFVLLAETRLALTAFRPVAFAEVELAAW